MNGKELLDLAEVKRVPLQPGDILAVYVPKEPSDQEFFEITSRLSQALGREVKVIVMPPGWDLKAMGPNDTPMQVHPGFGHHMTGEEFPADGSWSAEVSST